jgi:hypothetical protein
MTALKALTIVAALLACGTSLAMAQNGLPTGGERPVAGGANGGGWAGGWYGGAPGYGYGGYGYAAAPLYGYAAPAYDYGYAAPAYVAPPVYAAPVVSSYYAAPQPIYDYTPGYWPEAIGAATDTGGDGSCRQCSHHSQSQGRPEGGA